jgi:hypothetical protein
LRDESNRVYKKQQVDTNVSTTRTRAIDNKIDSKELHKIITRQSIVKIAGVVLESRESLLTIEGCDIEEVLP